MKKKFKLDTNLVRGGLTRSNFKETSEAIFLNSGFVYDSAEQAEAIFLGKKKGFQYSRYANPTVEMFEQRLALLDGSEACFATASGMAAVFGSMMCQLKAGDHVVSASALFGSCRYILNDILPKFGIEVSFIDGKNIIQSGKVVGEIIKIDGLRVEYKEGFGLMRASNTTPVIVLRFEADTENKLKEIQAEFKSILEQHISPEKIPF